MYGIGGERRLTEFELDELPGYEGSKPVRVGNAASEQFQLDVYGEVIGVAYRAAELLGGVDERLWPRWRTLIEYVESIWREPDDGIWESRGPRRHYTYSKVMAWVVFDRARAAGRAVRARRAPGALEAGARRDPPRGLRARLRRRAANVHAVLRLAGARRERAEHPARRASCPGPTSASPERSTRSRASWVATASSRATRRPRPTTDCPAAKGSSSPARSGWSTPWRSTAASTRRAPCSSACSA